MFTRFNNILLIAVLLTTAAFAYAEKQGIGAINYITSNNTANLTQSAPNSFVELDFSITTGESWDAKDQPNNIITNCINGETITGFETVNITIETIGRSYFSEAIMFFTNSNFQNSTDGVKFAVGSGNHTFGTQNFSTNAVIDITDTGFSDLVSLSDNKFYIQFYEDNDDNINSIDARFTNGKLKVWGIDLVIAENCQYAAAIPQTDLAVTYNLLTQTQIAVGEALQFEINVANTSSNIANNIIIKNTISDKLNFIDMQCSNGININNAEDVKSANVGNLSGNNNLNCIINTKILALGNIVNTVNVLADNDVDISNNFGILSIAGSPQSIPVNNLLTLFLLLILIVAIAYKQHYSG